MAPEILIDKITDIYSICIYKHVLSTNYRSFSSSSLYWILMNNLPLFVCPVKVALSGLSLKGGNQYKLYLVFQNMRIVITNYNYSYTFSG